MITPDNLETYFHLLNGKHKRLTRQFEAEVPAFTSHTEARTWFKSLFGDDFMMIDSEVYEGEKTYFYQIVIDRPTWEQGHEQMIRDGYATGTAFMLATQNVSITEDGNVHVVF